MTTMHGKGEESEAVSVPPRGNRGDGVNRGPFGSLVKCLAVSRQEIAAHKEWLHHWIGKVSLMQPLPQTCKSLLSCHEWVAVISSHCSRSPACKRFLDIIKMLLTEVLNM